MHRRTVTRRSVLAVITFGSSLGGCLAGSREGEFINVNDGTFNPPRKELEPGTEVTWRNRGLREHTITSTQFHQRAVDWALEKTLDTDETVSHTFQESGLYEYYCEHHGEANECGVVVVGDAEPPDLLPCDPQA